MCHKAQPFIDPYVPYTGKRGSILEYRMGLRKGVGTTSECFNRVGLNGARLMYTPRISAPAWDYFYRSQSEGKPYPDRFYLPDEFSELFAEDSRIRTLLEVGCGIGSTVLPLTLQTNKIVKDMSHQHKYGHNAATLLTHIHAIDISREGLYIIRKRLSELEHKVTNSDNARTSAQNCVRQCLVHPCSTSCPHRENYVFNLHPSITTEQCDITKKSPRLLTFFDDEFSTNMLPSNKYDAVTIIFVLSAIPVERLLQAVRNVGSCVRRGGIVFVRDYSEGDSTAKKHNTTLLSHKYSTEGISALEVRSSFESNPPPPSTSPEIFLSSKVRSDGTLTTFFNSESMKYFFISCGFSLIDCRIIETSKLNRKTTQMMVRRFIQCKFCKEL